MRVSSKEFRVAMPGLRSGPMLGFLSAHRVCRGAEVGSSFALLALLTLVTLAWPTQTPAQPSITVLASADNNGSQLPNASSSPSISADGRFVVFSGGTSAALSGGCTGGVLVRDLAVGTTTCVAASGSNAVISGDGRFVAFQSADTTLTPACTFTGHVYVRDLQLGTTTCVSVDVNGAGIIGGTSDVVSISSNGRYVAFKAGVLSVVAPGCTTGQQIFVRDLTPAAGPPTTTCASVSLDGVGDNSFLGPVGPSLSDNGRLVAFRSSGNNMDPAGKCTTGGVYVRNLDSGVTACVSLDANGNAVGGDLPGVSGDGRFVLFRSSGLNIGVCVFGQSHAYVRELATGTTTCASLAANVTPLASSFPTSISADGRFVAFSYGDFLGSPTGATVNPSLTAMGCPLSGSNTVQVFVRDRVASTTRCVSGDQSGAGPNVSASGGSLSGDGQVVAFQSNATNLVPVDLNGQPDVFVNGPRVTLTVTKQGAGTVTSARPGIACGADCTQDYLRGTIVTLTPTADAGSVFASFGGDAGCGTVVAVSTNLACTATFLPLFTLTVGRTGSGTGFVFSEPSGITCGNDCSEILPSGTVVTLGPISIGASVFTGFSGDGDCSDGLVMLSGNTSCVATFAPLSVDPVSTGPGGATAAGESLNPSVSDDGRFVAFESTAADLTPDCAMPIRQIYVLDRVERAVRCVSRAPNGAPGSGPSEQPGLSGDGRIVAFQSSAPNLVAGCTSAGTQAFVRHLDTLVTECATVGLGGVAANAESGSPALSRDGRFVAFHSEATNLTADCRTGVRQIFVRDLATQTTVCASLGGAPGNLASSEPAISRDGTVVAFQSSATNFTGSGCTGAGLQVFVWDRASGTITCVSRGPAGVPGDGASEAPALNDDGTVVAFESDARNLTADCQTGIRQIFVHNRVTGTTRCVSLTRDGVPGNAASSEAAVSGNGLVMAFATGATNLLGGGGAPPAGVVAQTGNLSQVLRRSMSVAANVTELVSQTGGTQGNDASRHPALSRDGRVTVFQTRATNLLPGDANGAEDIVVAEGGAIVGPPPPPAGRVRITSPVDFSQFALAGPTPVPFAWTALAEAAQYGFEFTGANRVFANPNGNALDPVNGAGGAGGGFVVPRTGFTAVVGPGFPPGSYQVRVIGLSAAGQFVGTFSDAVTLVLGDVPSAIPSGARVVFTSPADGSQLARGSLVTFDWTALVGVTQYLVEFTAPNAQFTMPNATVLADPGAAGRVPVAGTSISALVGPGIPVGTYQVRVIGLSATNTPVGSFSDALTLTVR